MSLVPGKSAHDVKGPQNLSEKYADVIPELDRQFRDDTIATMNRVLLWADQLRAALDYRGFVETMNASLPVMLAVMHVESRGDPMAVGPAIKGGHARGLFQLAPSVRSDYKLSNAEAHDPETCINTMAKHATKGNYRAALADGNAREVYYYHNQGNWARNVRNPPTHIKSFMRWVEALAPMYAYALERRERVGSAFL